MKTEPARSQIAQPYVTGRCCPGTIRGASLAYASQSPWLFNDSLRNNVLFGRAPMPRRYRRVLAACALQDDIKLLPHEDRELIGEQGIVLSGGQRQRVAVARALYSNADVVILVRLLLKL